MGGLHSETGVGKIQTKSKSNMTFTLFCWFYVVSVNLKNRNKTKRKERVPLRFELEKSDDQFAPGASVPKH